MVDLTGLGLLLGGVQPGYQQATLNQQRIDQNRLALAQQQAAAGMRYPLNIFDTGETVTPAGDMAGGLGRDILRGGDVGPAITGTQQAPASDIPSSVLQGPVSPAGPITPDPRQAAAAAAAGYGRAAGGPLGYTGLLPGQGGLAGSFSPYQMAQVEPDLSRIAAGGPQRPPVAPPQQPVMAGAPLPGLGAIGGAQPLGFPSGAYGGPQAQRPGTMGAVDQFGMPRRVTLGQLFNRLKDANPDVPDSVLMNAAIKMESALGSDERAVLNYIARISGQQTGLEKVQLQQQEANKRTAMRIDAVAAQSGAGAVLSDENARFLAEEANAGNPDWVKGLGWGKTRTINTGKVLDWQRKLLSPEGQKEAAGGEFGPGGAGGEVSARKIEFGALSAGAKTAFIQATKVNLGIHEIAYYAPKVEEISNKIDRSEYPTINAIQLAIEKGTGSEDVVEFYSWIQSLKNAYSIIAGRGNTQMTDLARRKADDMINADWSKGQISRSIKVMQEEADRAHAAGEDVFTETTERVRGGRPPATTKGASIPPKAGEIQDGYRFKGGDPGDPNNWEPVQ